MKSRVKFARTRADVFLFIYLFAKCSLQKSEKADGEPKGACKIKIHAFVAFALTTGAVYAGDRRGQKTSPHC